MVIVVVFSTGCLFPGEFLLLTVDTLTLPHLVFTDCNNSSQLAWHFKEMQGQRAGGLSPITIGLRGEFESYRFALMLLSFYRAAEICECGGQQ